MGIRGKEENYVFVGWNMGKFLGIFENFIMKCFIFKGEKSIFK